MLLTTYYSTYICTYLTLILCVSRCLESGIARCIPTYYETLLFYSTLPCPSLTLSITTYLMYPYA